MTARLFSVPLESASVSSLFCPHPSGSLNGTQPQRRSPSNPGRISAKALPDKPVRTPPGESVDLIPIWSGLLESLPEGVIVISRSLKPIYANLKAKEICQGLSEIQLSALELPTAVSEVCHRLIRGNRPINHPLVLECQTNSQQTIRISARWFYTATHRNSKVLDTDLGISSLSMPEPEIYQQPYILVSIENCTESLKEELRIEQKKYDLTDREAEIWMLLRQEYTYQEIAKMLQISLNTVKTHVKNVYAKRRSFQGQERFWCSE